MREPWTVAGSPVESPVPDGTAVTLDPEARFYGRDLIAGGSPWRLLRLSVGSRNAAEQWRGGGVVGPGEGRLARTFVQQGLLHPLFWEPDDLDDVDVIVPVRDASALGTLLDDLRGLHVTIVDDGSLDPAAVADCANRNGAQLVRLTQNVGPGAARNAGAQATGRPFIWFLDDDVTLADAPSIGRFLRAHFGDPVVGAVAPRIRGRAGPSARDRFEQRCSPLDMGARSALVVPGGVVGYVPSACLLVRRRAFGDGFDPVLRVGEDVDLVWRLHDQGWLVRYVADVVVAHAARDTWSTWWRQRVRYGQSASELASRHGARLAPVRADLWTLVAWASVLARRPLVAGRVVRVTRDRLARRVDVGGGDHVAVANALIGRSVIGAAGPLARSIVRTYGPVLVAASVHPKLRRPALAVFTLGTAWRWRHERPRVTDVPMGIADDVAYATGVAVGAWRARSLVALTPVIARSSIGLGELLGLPARRPRVRS